MQYFGTDKDFPSDRFLIDRTYRADEILAEDPDAFFHVTKILGRYPCNVLFAVVRRPNNVHFKEFGVSFAMTDSATFQCTGGGRSDYITFCEDTDIRLADADHLIHGESVPTGSIIDALNGLTRYDKQDECDAGIGDEMQESCDGEWIRVSDLQDVISEIIHGNLK
jgi:hypothetical protein